MSIIESLKETLTQYLCFLLLKENYYQFFKKTSQFDTIFVSFQTPFTQLAAHPFQLHQIFSPLSPGVGTSWLSHHFATLCNKFIKTNSGKTK